METEKKETNYIVPASIIIAGALIAGSLWVSGNQTGNVNGNDETAPENVSFSEITENDHILGDPNAAITLVEYSDLECPFCASFHPTLERIVAENSDVRWVYRHFPLSSIHSQAVSSAVASECVSEIAGNDAFWQFVDTMFQNQSSLGQPFYESTANELGIATSELATCMEREDIQKIVSDGFNEARGTGGTGTPHTLIVVDGEVLGTIPGAMPYENVSSILDQVRAQI